MSFARDGLPAGLSGADMPTRFVGATTSGHPAAGPYAVGDFSVDQSGSFWVCTVAGSPGTWQQVSGGSGFSNPMTTSGDTIYGGSSGTASRLAGDTSNIRKFLREQASGGVAQPPAWDTIQAADIPTLNQSTTGTASNITGTLDQVPAPAAAVSLNSKKITGLANGTASSDAAAFGQIPATLDVVPAPVANVSLNSHKITGLANGSASTDAAAFGQIPSVDTTASDIAEPGTQAAGSNTLSAAADHVHPIPLWLPADNGLLVANLDPGACASNNTTTAGTVYVMRLMIRRGITLSKLWFELVTPGAGASTGSFAGLYNSSGTRLTGSSDIGGSLTGSGGPFSVTLTSAQVISAGSFVWAALVVNLATTQPTLLRGTGSPAAANVNLTAANFRNGTVSTGQTALPSSFTPSSLTTGNMWWTGGS